MILSHSDRSIRIESSGASYRVHVGGAGQVILLLHGFTGGAASWDRLASDLMRSALVIRPDLLGHGESSAPSAPERYHMEHAAADLIAMLDALDVDRAVLHGYSMGGRLALYTALAYPDRCTALSLESASPGLQTAAEREARRASDAALASRILETGIESFVEEWERLPLFAPQHRLPAEVRGRQREQRLRQNPLGLANSLLGMGTGVQPSLWDDLGRLSVPVMLMTGDLDAKFTRIADQMAQKIASCERVRVPDAGHAVYLEQPERWLDAVGTFLQRL